MFVLIFRRMADFFAGNKKILNSAFAGKFFKPRSVLSASVSFQLRFGRQRRSRNSLYMKDNRLKDNKLHRQRVHYGLGAVVSQSLLLGMTFVMIKSHAINSFLD